MLFISQKLTQVWRIKPVLRIYIFPLNLLSCVQKSLKNIQKKFHWDRMKHKHVIEVSNICPTITLKQSISGEAELQIFDSQGRAEVRKWNFTSLEVPAEMKCGGGLSHLWKSWSKKCGSGTWDLSKSYMFGKPNLTSLPIKVKRKCGSEASDL